MRISFETDRALTKKEKRAEKKERREQSREAQQAAELFTTGSNKIRRSLDKKKLRFVHNKIKDTLLKAASSMGFQLEGRVQREACVSKKWQVVPSTFKDAAW